MMRRVARPFAIIGLVAAIVGAVGGITLRIVDPVPVVPNTFGFSDISLLSFEFLGVTFTSVGALLMVRRPENAVGWCMVVIGAAYALSGLAAAATFSAVADGPAGAVTAGLAGWLAVFFSSIGGLVFVLGLIFPTGRGHTPAWHRAIVIGAIAAPWIVVVVFLIRPGPLHLFPSIDNPIGVGPDVRSVFGSQVSALIAASMLWFAPILIWSIVSRYRMSDSVGRQQLKWFILSLLVALGGIVVAGVGALISHEPPEAGLVVFGFAGAFVPVAIGIAILRHGLYDIDRIISRTITYAVVSAILAIVFGGAILLLSAGLAQLTNGQTIAVAASTLAAFATFQPVRSRVQAAVDRRFNRARYDAEQTAAAFAERLRNEVDLARLRVELVDTVEDAVRPVSATVWLRTGSGAGRI